MPRSATQQRLRGLSLGFRHTGCRVLDLRFRFLGGKITWSIWGVCAGIFISIFVYPCKNYGGLYTECIGLHKTDRLGGYCFM